MELTLKNTEVSGKANEIASFKETISCSSYLASLLAEVDKIVPPLWSLADYVAVNPFLGLSNEKFLAARRTLVEVRDCELLPTAEYFRNQMEANAYDHADLEQACFQASQEYAEWYQDIELADIVAILNDDLLSENEHERTVRTLAEVIDQCDGSDWNSHIINDISRNVASYYDQGQAAWSNPWKQVSLYAAWRQSALISRRMEMLGISGFRQFVAYLPEDPNEAIFQLLIQLEVPRHAWRQVLLSEIFSVAGWASYAKNQSTDSLPHKTDSNDLIDLLAIRLAYDASLTIHPLSSASTTFYYTELWKLKLDFSSQKSSQPSMDVLARYVLQTAQEIGFRRNLCNKLAYQSKPVEQSSRKSAQLVFCIDVRSEVMRRKLEAIAENVETFGFAGFFGMAMQYVPMGHSEGSAQCPALLRPAFLVHEQLSGVSQEEQTTAIRKRQLDCTERKIWKSFQSSAASCFSFVETLGVFYVGKLLKDSLQSMRTFTAGQDSSQAAKQRDQKGHEISMSIAAEFSLEMQCKLAEGVLRNLGLTENFARLVVLCGHGAAVTNNPYQAGLNCGACGGHSGEPNARVAAKLLNDPVIRQYLQLKGIVIPGDTWFVPAWHNTTTDEIQFLATELLPESHSEDLKRLDASTRHASQLCREERSQRMGASSSLDLFRRSRDWSETRPEWGLAGNAAFVVAPRWRTAGLDLDGRVFMHSYDPQKDSDGKVLELILTAPMIVTSWINLQYYASAVDNHAFGSGNKLIHNVVGQFGVFEGNGGDLMTGLPWQSVHDGTKLQHEPLRLVVIVDAKRERVDQILKNHPAVGDLISNGWISLIVLEDEQYFRWTDGRDWEACPESELQH